MYRTARVMCSATAQVTCKSMLMRLRLQRNHLMASSLVVMLKIETLTSRRCTKSEHNGCSVLLLATDHPLRSVASAEFLSYSPSHVMTDSPVVPSICPLLCYLIPLSAGQSFVCNIFTEYDGRIVFKNLLRYL